MDERSAIANDPQPRTGGSVMQVKAFFYFYVSLILGQMLVVAVSVTIGHCALAGAALAVSPFTLLPIVAWERRNGDRVFFGGVVVMTQAAYGTTLSLILVGHAPLSDVAIFNGVFVGLAIPLILYLNQGPNTT
ncbi:hypothetical protein ACIP4Y_28520 [Streptomyces sp. NPDC088810]|uniref:hypothetical protein n=1 Tax=Streptomyces sp. NPDC088810 TaxID=3365904 RepID=UPI003805FC59